MGKRVGRGVERVRKAKRKEGTDISKDDPLQNKLNELVYQFTKKKGVLHELTIDVLGIDNEQITTGIQALNKKRAEVALLEKTRTDLF